jgi:hypothetical protein
MLKEAPKSRRFRIWPICLLIVVVSASMFVHMASQPSEQFVSVNFARPMPKRNHSP